MYRKIALVLTGVLLSLLAIFTVAQAQNTTGNAYGGPGLLGQPFMPTRRLMPAP